jgi:hypothetical protein
MNSVLENSAEDAVLGRVEFGHFYTWNKERGCWQNDDESVRVFVPTDAHSCWRVFILGATTFTKLPGLRGEERAFSFAAHMINHPLVSNVVEELYYEVPIEDPG